jgi:hypothetical protein
VIVVVDIALQSSREFIDTSEFVKVKELGFQCTEEAFHGSIIEAISLA